MRTPIPFGPLALARCCSRRAVCARRRARRSHARAAGGRRGRGTPAGGARRADRAGRPRGPHRPRVGPRARPAGAHRGARAVARTRPPEGRRVRVTSVLSESPGRLVFSARLVGGAGRAAARPRLGLDGHGRRRDLSLASVPWPGAAGHLDVVRQARTPRSPPRSWTSRSWTTTAGRALAPRRSASTAGRTAGCAWSRGTALRGPRWPVRTPGGLLAGRGARGCVLGDDQPRRAAPPLRGGGRAPAWSAATPTRCPGRAPAPACASVAGTNLIEGTVEGLGGGPFLAIDADGAAARGDERGRLLGLGDPEQRSRRQRWPYHGPALVVASTTLPPREARRRWSCWSGAPRTRRSRACPSTAAVRALAARAAGARARASVAAGGARRRHAPAGLRGRAGRERPARGGRMRRPSLLARRPPGAALGPRYGGESTIGGAVCPLIRPIPPPRPRLTERTLASAGARDARPRRARRAPSRRPRAELDRRGGRPRVDAHAASRSAVPRRDPAGRRRRRALAPALPAQLARPRPTAWRPRSRAARPSARPVDRRPARPVGARRRARGAAAPVARCRRRSRPWPRRPRPSTGASGSGAGPFVPGARTPRRLELAAFSGHVRGRPYLDRVAVVALGDRDAAQAELDAGRAHVALGTAAEASRPRRCSCSSSTRASAPLDRADGAAGPVASVDGRTLVDHLVPGGDARTALAAAPPVDARSSRHARPRACPSRAARDRRRPRRPAGRQPARAWPVSPTWASTRRVRPMDAPADARSARPRARLLWWSPEVAEAGLALRELVALVPGADRRGTGRR